MYAYTYEQEDKQMITVILSSTYLFGVAVACTELIRPNSGTVDLVTDGLVSSAAFSCSVGYTLQGKATLFCGTDGVWTDVEPICSRFQYFSIQIILF